MTFVNLATLVPRCCLFQAEQTDAEGEITVLCSTPRKIAVGMFCPCHEWPQATRKYWVLGMLGGNSISPFYWYRITKRNLTDFSRIIKSHTYICLHKTSNTMFFLKAYTHTHVVKWKQNLLHSSLSPRKPPRLVINIRHLIQVSLQ